MEKDYREENGEPALDGVVFHPRPLLKREGKHWHDLSLISSSLRLTLHNLKFCDVPSRRGRYPSVVFQPYNSFKDNTFRILENRRWRAGGLWKKGDGNVR